MLSSSGADMVPEPSSAPGCGLDIMAFKVVASPEKRDSAHEGLSKRVIWVYHWGNCMMSVEVHSGSSPTSSVILPLYQLLSQIPNQPPKRATQDAYHRCLFSDPSDVIHASAEA